MVGHWTSKFSFRTGAVRSREIGYLLGSHDELEAEDVPYTVIITWHVGKWYQEEFKWSARSASVCSSPKEQLVAIGEGGDFLVFGQGDMLEENIYNIVGRSDRLGNLTRIQNVCGKCYAVGMDRQVYRRDGLLDWVRIDAGLPAAEGQTAGFMSISGFSEKDIYAVGWAGEIWRFDGQVWSQIDSPTNLNLTSVCCAGDGYIYACGQAGVLIEGDGQSWEILDHDETDQDFWDVHWFEGKLYVSTIEFLYTLDGESLTMVDFGDDPPESCYHLSSADGVLWSIGSKDVMAFDGSKWARID